LLHNIADARIVESDVPDYYANRRHVGKAPDMPSADIRKAGQGVWPVLRISQQMVHFIGGADVVGRRWPANHACFPYLNEMFGHRPSAAFGDGFPKPAAPARPVITAVFNP